MCPFVLLLFLWGTRPMAPAHIKWHGRRWEIKYVNTIKGDKSLEKGNVYFGYTYFEQHRIEILVGRPIELEAGTVYHELEHIVVGEDFSDERLTGHMAIYRLEPMSILLGQNPELEDYFVAAYGKQK